MMAVERDVKSIAEDVQANIGSVKALLSAVDDKIRFYLLDKTCYGPYWELVKYHADEIQALLAVTESMVFEMDRDQSMVIDILCGSKPGGRNG